MPPDAPKPSKAKKCKTVCLKICNAVKALLTLSIPSFFLWSGVLYLATAGFVMIMGPAIDDFLCKVYVPADKLKDCANDPTVGGKGACYESAMNLTIMLKAGNSTQGSYNDLIASSKEWHCLAAALEAADPVKMLRLLKTAVTDANSESKVSKKCLKFHCAVLDMALTHEDLVLQPKSDISEGCPNGEDTKQQSNASHCVCSKLWGRMTADDIAFFEDPLFCNKQAPTTQTTTTTTTNTTTIAPPAVTAAPGAATRLLQEVTVAKAAPGGATRMLQEAVMGEFLETEEDLDCGEDDCSPRSRPRGKKPTDFKDVVAAFHADEESYQSLGHVTPAPHVRQLGHIGATQAPVDDPAKNELLKPFEVGEFSRCTCYQVCQPGSQMASVTCASPPCQTPKPAAAQTCTCTHCAACHAEFNAFLVMASSALQGLISLFVWLGIVYMNSIPETHLVKLSWLQWFVGIFVKRLPMLVRTAVLVNIGLACFLLFQTFVPEEILSYEPDCNNTPALRLMTLFIASVMAFQVLLGVTAKHLNRMYPYLFKPLRDNMPGPLKIIAKVLRSLGP